MRASIAGVLALVLLPLGCGGGEPAGDDAPGSAAVDAVAPAVTGQDQAAGQAGSANWVEYAIAGDFGAQGRDTDVVLCSQGDEGQLNVAARGVWFLDMEVEGTAAAQHAARITVTLPAGLEGAPSDPFARRMKGEGSATLRDVGTDAFGLRVVEVDFSAGELSNGDGQTVTASGRFSCSIL